MLNLKELKQSQLSPGIHIIQKVDTDTNFKHLEVKNVTEIQMYSHFASSVSTQSVTTAQTALVP